MEIKLTDNSKVCLHWIRPGVLAIELHQPRTMKDGHGFWLAGSALLAGEELATFLSEMNKNTHEARL